MKEFIEVYYSERDKVENFIQESLENIDTCSENYKILFKTFRSLELIYEVDEESKRQITPNIYPKKTDDNEINKSREYLLDRIEINDNGYGFTSPYKSNATKNLCITVAKKEGGTIVYMDFDLAKILERLGLIEKHIVFNGLEKIFYTFAGFFMMVIAFSAVLYATIDFVTNITENNLTIHTIFKPIISATLGLAIFDLAKTVLEQEVFFKSYSKDQKGEIKVLTKFLFTVLIALSIETLMVVFKIAMEANGAMINALYLMSGISFIIIALSIFIYVTKNKKN